jgi:HupE / UreJ protein
MNYLICILFCTWSMLAFAHKPSDSYLSIDIKNNQLSGRWDIALRDLDFAIGLDKNDDGAITWEELRAKTSEIGLYVFSHLQLGVSDKTCSLLPKAMKVDGHTDGTYAVLLFDSDCEVTNSNEITIGYRLFANLDPQHRGLLHLTHNNTNLAAVLVPSQPSRTFNLSSKRSHWLEALDFIHEGIWHIWIGFDHILFLFSLLIPSVMMYQSGRWQAAPNFKSACWDVLKVVTAFTLAHSITLSLAILGLVELPSRWVESCIAASVILAALTNIFPLFRHQRTVLAFTFGLIHGFGFASILTDLGLSSTTKLWGLLGFNLGVEIGQLVLVAGFLPITYKFSRSPLYKPVVLKSCSLAIAGLASLWLLERAFGILVQV